MTQALFDIEGGAYVARYKHPNIPVEIEIHIFADGIDPCNKQYNQDGLTHVCLQIDNREAFIESLPDLIKRDPRKEFLVVYDNPGGWQNIFLKDFEGNWVELREKL